MSTPTAATGILETHMEVRLSATAEAVWQALTTEIGAWWPEEFYAGGEPTRRQYHLEAEPGGRMFEEWEDGGGVLWATVVTVNPEKQLQVMGTSFPNWGGPSIWFGTWELEVDGPDTLLRFSDSTFGRISDSLAEQKDRGWRYLFGGVLKAHIEGTPVPEWEE